MNAQNIASAQPRTPLQTELIVPLDITHLQIGSPVLVRVDMPWTGEECTLATGSMVRGHVVELTRRSKTEKNSTVALEFDGADCKGSTETKRTFTLVALVGGIRGTGQSGVVEGPPLANDLPQSLGGGGGSGFRSLAGASSITDNFALQAHKLPPTITPGQVIDLDKTRLDMSKGPDNASSIVAIGRNIRLEAGTVLILTHGPTAAVSTFAKGAAQPEAGRTTATAASPSNTASASIPPLNAPASPELRDETEICSGSCTHLTAADTINSAIPSRADVVLPLRALGYPAPGPHEMAHLSTDITVTYLSEHVLLCTFDPHRLRERLGAEEESARTVRAVLIDAQTHTVMRVLDWRIRGDGQYLWRLPGGHVLLHTSQQLHELDATMKTVRTLPVEGKLAWVMASPSGEYLAIGTTRERYSMATRHELERVLPDEAEEDVEVRVVHRGTDILLTAVRSSKSPAPVLSDTGELRVLRRKAGVWTLYEQPWNATRRDIANLHSACRPTLSAPQQDLIFVVGCTSTGARWYRMLREDGHPVLNAEYLLNEIEHGAQSGPGNSFVVRLVRTARPLAENQPFRPDDLSTENLAVYSKINGSRLKQIASPDFALSQLGAAISPDGAEMTLAGRNGLLFFSLRGGSRIEPYQASRFPAAASQ